MGLAKLPVVTNIPADPGQPAIAPSTVCTPPPPPDDSGGDPPTDPVLGDPIILLVPKNPNDESAGEVIVGSLAPAPAGYTCGPETIFIPDPNFPGGLIAVSGIICHWNYP